MRFEAHPRVSASIEEEGCLLPGRVDVIIVGELHQGEECVPVVLSFSDEDPQVLFQFLVNHIGKLQCIVLTGHQTVTV